jgi:hypothetical protein
LPPWLPFDASLKLSYARKWQTRVDEFGADVTSRSGLDAEEVAARLDENEVLGDAALQAVMKVARTSDWGIHAGLSALISAALRDDALVDASAYYVSVLAQLEASPRTAVVRLPLGRGNVERQ